MKTVQNGDYVMVHYTGTMSDGKVFDSSEGREPLEFQVGGGDLIEGFDRAVVGMEVGQEKKITLSPDEAYGPRDDEMLQKVPRSAVEGQLDPEVGQTVLVQMQNGDTIPVTIREVTPEYITLDPNHPLAGETLNFQIKIVEINDHATMGCGCGCGEPHESCCGGDPGSSDCGGCDE